MKNLRTNYYSWEKHSPSFFSLFVARWISGFFTTEKNNKHKRSGGEIFINISFFDEHFSLTVASMMLDGFTGYTCGYKKSFFMAIKSMLLSLLQKDSKIDLQNDEIDHDFHGALTLSSRELFKKQYIYSASDPVQQLIDIQKNRNLNIVLLPHLLFWNRSPESIGGRTTMGNKNIFQILYTVFTSSTPPYFKELKPVALSDFNTAGELVDGLKQVYEDEKRIVLGPVLKPKNEIRKDILWSEPVERQIAELISDNEEMKITYRKKAYKYFNEIAADFSIVYVKYFALTLEKIYKRIFDSIEYNREDLLSVMEKTKGRTPVLVPSHKSMMDFLLISSLLYRENIIPPHVVTGLNMNFFPMGRLFRKSGGFFMRRTFRDNLLYSIVFRQYMDFLVKEQYALEFFIEGGRSRNGRLLKSKIGILKYLSESIKDTDNSLMFIPVSINYDRIFEEKSFIKEVNGKSKREESAAEFAKARKLLKKNFGSVYISYGEPVDYQDLCHDSKGDLALIAEKIAGTINENMKVSVNGFLSLGLLAEEGKGFFLKDFSDKMSFLYRYMQERKIPAGKLFSQALHTDHVLLPAMRSLEEEYLLTFDEARDPKNPFIIKSKELRSHLYYYRNTIAHHFISLASTATAIIISDNSNGLSKEEIFTYYKKINNLLSAEFCITSLNNESFNRDIEFLLHERIIAKIDESFSLTDESFSAARFLSRIVIDILDSFLIVLSTLMKAPEQKYNENVLLKDIQKEGVQLLHLDAVSCDEALSLLQYKNIINHYCDNHILTIDKSKGEKDRLYTGDEKAIEEEYSFITRILTLLSRKKSELYLAQQKKFKKIG